MLNLLFKIKLLRAIFIGWQKYCYITTEILFEKKLKTKDGKMKKNVIILICFTIISFGFIYSTHATPILKISNGAESVTIMDNVGLDGSDILGVVNFSGSLGVFNVNVVTGITYPTIGSLAVPEMHINSVNVSSLSSSEVGSLRISFSETGFGTSDTVLAGFQTDVYGFTQGSVSFLTSFNSKEISNFDLLGVGSFSDSTTYIGSPDNPFSLTAVATINHIGMNTTSFGMHISSIADADGVSVPEPGTIILLGMGLLGIGVFNMRKNN